MKRSLLTVLLALTFVTAQAQDWGIKFGGFLKTDVIMNTRKNLEIRDGECYFYPLKETLDADKKDINEVLNVNMLSFQSRLIGKITAPDFLGAKVNGTLEGEFFGTSEGDINGFRLRHALINLDWGTSKLMIGQYWNPLFFEDAFPKVVQYNTGVPYIPFTRNPQVRFVLMPSKEFEVNLTAMSQRDFTSSGPNGSSTEYLRNSGIPMMNLGFRYKSSSLFFGGNAQYKVLKPRTVTTANLKAEETVGGLTANAAIKVSPSEDFYATVEGTYAQNGNDLFMQGGYIAVITDAAKGIEKYYSTNNVSLAFDTQYGTKLMFGLFAGYSMNMGFSEEQTDASVTFYGRGGDIDNLMRISPRIMYKEGSVQLAAELDYSTAAYGAMNLKTGKVENTKSISNIRFQLAGYLFF